MLFRFGPYELDQASFELRRSNRRVRLAARPMELLLLLVKRRGEFGHTPKRSPGRSGQRTDFEDLDARINTAIAQIRYALIEEAAKPRYLETVIGKGYRFIGAVETITVAEVVAEGCSRGRICQLGRYAEWARFLAGPKRMAVAPMLNGPKTVLSNRPHLQKRKGRKPRPLAARYRAVGQPQHRSARIVGCCDPKGRLADKLSLDSCIACLPGRRRGNRLW